MDLPDPGRIIDRGRLTLRNKKTKTTRPYLVYLSGRQTEVVLSLITVHDIENITMECNYIAWGICIYIPYIKNPEYWHINIIQYIYPYIKPPEYWHNINIIQYIYPYIKPPEYWHNFNIIQSHTYTRKLNTNNILSHIDSTAQNVLFQMYIDTNLSWH